jgi:hypothetical protein
MKSLCGLQEGRGKDHSQPCLHCGGDDRQWYSVDDETLHCRKQENGCPVRSMDIIALYQHVHGVDFKTAFDRIAEASGYVSIAEMQSQKRTGGKSKLFRAGTIKKTAEYIYTDESGNALHRITRLDGIVDATGEPGKIYPQSHFVDGQWVKGAPSITYPLNLPALLNPETEIIIVCEGEKCCQWVNRLLRVAGIKNTVATTSPMGARNGRFWKEYFQRYLGLANKKIIVLPDNDTPGMEYAWTAVSAVFSVNSAADVKIVELVQSQPDMSEGGDIVDWIKSRLRELDSMHSSQEEQASAIADSLFDLCNRTEPITPDVAAKWNEPTKSESPKRYKTGKPSKKISTVRPILVKVSEVVEKAILWLWENKMPLGMLSLIAGLAGVGKSFWTVYMTAVITNGWKWADGSPSEKGSVLFFYGEEGLADTYKKRFQANGADQSKIIFLNGIELIDEDDERSEADVTLQMVDVIEKAIYDTEVKTGLPVKMVVIDPISNYWGDKKENSNAEVRSILKPLQHLAEKTGVAFVMIQHIGKGDKDHAQQKVLGSTGIVAACRSVWGIFVDPDDNSKRIFAPLKVNCGFNHTAVSYRIAPPDGTVEIDEKSIEGLTGDDIVRSQKQANAQKPGRPAKESNACVDFLTELLKDGDRPASECLESLKAEGFGVSTFRTVKKILGIESVRNGKTMFWHLPSETEVENVD